MEYGENEGSDTTKVFLCFIFKSLFGKGIKALQCPYSELAVPSTASQHLAPFRNALWLGLSSRNSPVPMTVLFYEQDCTESLL